MAAIAGGTAGNAALPTPAIFSTGFLAWSACGILGLLIGVIAVRRARIAPASPDAAPWENAASVGAAVAQPVAARFGVVLETVEGSA